LKVACGRQALAMSIPSNFFVVVVGLFSRLLSSTLFIVAGRNNCSATLEEEMGGRHCGWRWEGGRINGILEEQ
jgi:hypothetical protein